MRYLVTTVRANSKVISLRRRHFALREKCRKKIFLNEDHFDGGNFHG